jgi:AraC-like DNA-binding protein
MNQKFDIKNPNNTNWFFNIRKIDTAYQDYDETYPHQHKFYQILFFDKANGTHVIDDEEYKVQNRSIHFVSPNHIHHLSLEDGASGFVCMFKEELFFIHNESDKFLKEIDLFSNWNKNPVVQIDNANFDELNTILLFLKKEFDGQKMRRNEMLLMGLKTFLINSSRLGGNLKDLQISSKRKIIENFLGLVDEFYNENLPVSFYAEKLNITTTYLCRVIKEVYSKSVSEFVNERVILESKRIIKHSSKSIKEISFELGFEDPSYFSRFFKKNIGMTPVQYRKQIQK